MPKQVMYGSLDISGISLTSFNNISYKFSSFKYVMTADSIESLCCAYVLFSLINYARATAKEPNLLPSPTFCNILFRLKTNL